MSDFQTRKLSDGNPNPKYIDLLDEDQPLAGQKFACMSFISPEKIIKQRELYLFDCFVKQWEFSKSMEKFSDFLQFVSYKYNIKVDDIVNDLTEFTKEEQTKLRETTIQDDFKNFLDKQEDKLTEVFSKEHSFQTSVRGLKIRGVYPTQDEAEIRCKKLRDSDPNHDIFVGPVGIWIPWDPEAYKTGRVEFMEDELNQLHQEKLKNEERAKQEFDRRVKETKRKAIEENIKLAEKSNNVLTQTIDDNGELIGVKDTVNFDEREPSNPETAKLYNESLLQKNKTD